jgi:hypothetical protein
MALLGPGLWSARRKAATYTQDNTYRINVDTDIHALSEIRTHDPSFRANEDSTLTAYPLQSAVIRIYVNHKMEKAWLK